MASGDSSESNAPPPRRRVIKRYSNRKLYDTRDSTYVTLLQIAEMVRAGEDVQIIDNASKEDKTDVTLALIISEELKQRPRAIPLATLKALIRNRGERLLSHLRDCPIGRLIPNPNELVEEEVDVSQGKEPQKGLRATLEQWQTVVDERIRAVLPTFAAFRDVQLELKRLGERLDEMERRIDELRDKSGGGGPTE